MTVTEAPAPAGKGSPLEVFVAFLRLGLTSFGGPIAHLGYFRQEFVARRHWLDEAAYAVTPRQQQRIIDAAQGWLLAHPEHAEFELRFDAMLIAPRSLPRHVLAAFDASS